MIRHIARVIYMSFGVVFVGLFMVAIAGALMGIRMVPVLTGSMKPHYPPDSLVFTRPVTTSSLEVGQIIAFSPPPSFITPGNRLIMHRIIKLQHAGKGVIVNTRGDNNPAQDPWTLNLTDTKTYTAFQVVPKLGVIAIAVQSKNKSVSGAAVGGIALLIGALFLWPMRKRRRAENAISESFDLRETWPLAASAPHELRSALAQVRTSVEMALDISDSPQQVGLLEVANRGSDRLVATVEKFLLASGLEAWTNEVNLQVRELITSVAAEMDIPHDHVLLGQTNGNWQVLGNSVAVRRALRSMVEHVKYVTDAAGDLTMTMNDGRREVKVKVNAPLVMGTENRMLRWESESSLNLALVERVAHDHGGSIAHHTADGAVFVEFTIPKYKVTKKAQREFAKDQR